MTDLAMYLLAIQEVEKKEREDQFFISLGLQYCEHQARWAIDPRQRTTFKMVIGN